MRKFIVITALVAACFSAKAQMSNEYIGKTSIENLKVSFKYEKFSQYDETIIINDVTYSIDWKNSDITIDGDVFLITKSYCDIEKRQTIIFFNNQQLTIKYTPDWKRCIGYELK